MYISPVIHLFLRTFHSLHFTKTISSHPNIQIWLNSISLHTWNCISFAVKDDWFLKTKKYYPSFSFIADSSMAKRWKRWTRLSICFFVIFSKYKKIYPARFTKTLILDLFDYYSENQKTFNLSDLMNEVYYVNISDKI